MPQIAASGRLHWGVLVRPLIEALQIAAGLIPLIWIGFGKDELWIAGVYGLSVVVRVITSAIRFNTFSYRVTGEEMVMSWGLVSRTHRAIPLARVVNITTRRALWHRLVGALEMRLETAGGGNEDAVIEALEPSKAVLLRRAIERAKGGERPVEEAKPESRVLLRHGTPRLIVHGLTSSQLAAVAAVAFFLYENLPALGYETEELLSSTPLETLLVYGSIGIALAWLGSVALSAIRFGRFTLERAPEGHLTTHFGLISQREGRVFPKKIQSLVIYESLLRRPFGLATLKVLTAGGIALQDPSSGSEFLSPIARREEVRPLMREVFPNLSELPPLQRVHRLAIRRNFIRVSLLPIVAVVVAGFVWDLRLLWLVPAFLPLGLLIAWRRWVNTGYAVLPRHLVVRRGLFNRTTHVIPKDKLQAFILSRNPFDRRLGLASLALDTAARSQTFAPRIPDITPDEAVRLRTEAQVLAPAEAAIPAGMAGPGKIPGSPQDGRRTP